MHQHAGAPRGILYNEHMEGDGPNIFKHAWGGLDRN